MSIKVDISDHDLKIVEDNDSFNVFKSNLLVLFIKLDQREKVDNEEINLKVRTIKYRKNYPLDFNRMWASLSDDSPYLLEFKNYELINITPL